MHLFLTSFEEKKYSIWDILRVSEERVVFQVRRVLRMRLDDCIDVQSGGFRYRIRLCELDKTFLLWSIVSIESFSGKDTDNVEAKRSLSLFVALPNSVKKMSLIVQKLTEIGVDRLVFWEAERSQLTLRGQKGIKNKEKWMDKMWKVALEAVEQSKWWFVPVLDFVSSLDLLTDFWDTSYIVFDTETIAGGVIEEKGKAEWIVWDVCCVVWPEWWLWTSDWHSLETKKISRVSLWSTILRMETAAIVWARYMKNKNVCL